MYSFAQRPNCMVIDEPFYAPFLKRTDLNHPGKKETLDSYPNSSEGSIERINMFIRSSENKEIYLKNMAHHMVDVPWDWTKNAAHIFWIRHPRKVIRSFSKVLPNLSLSDIGIVEQANQWRKVQQFHGRKIIVDSDEMLLNPEKTFPAICDSLGIPFYTQMLSWSKGLKPFDGTWWPHWYSNVHKTSSFESGSQLGTPLNTKYSKIELDAMPYYLELYRSRLKFS